jgi:Ser/Thr protein kinase RdoA (MazF antagonist)
VGAALERYGLGGARLVPLRVGGFKQAIKASDPERGEFVVRLYGLPPAEMGRQAAETGPATAASLRSPLVLRSQMAWLSALARDTGLPVPVPVSALDGAFVVRVGGEGDPWARHATLVRWVPGETATGGTRRTLAEADLRAVGSLVAGMHAHAERYVPPEGSVFPRWDWDWPFGGSAPLWADGPGFYSEEEMGIFRETRRRVRALLGELGYGGQAFGLVHRDPTLGNLVFSGGRAGP